MAEQHDGSGKHEWTPGKLIMLRPGELGIVLWSAAYFFFLLFGYFMLRPVREALGSRDLEKLPWLMTATMIAMVVVNPLFAALVSRMPRRKFIPLVSRFFMLNQLGFFAAMMWGDWKETGYAFYVWVSVYNLFVVSVFWAFMTDAHGKERSRRVFGMVGIGGTLGALLGALATKQLSAAIAPAWMLLAALVPMELAVQCMRQVAKRAEKEAVTRGDAAVGAGEPGPGMFEGLKLIAKSPYLAGICLYVFVFALTSTFLYMEQARMIKAAFPDEGERTKAFANLDMWTQILTLVTQIFLTSRIVKWFGVSITLAVLPVVTIIGFALLAMHPTLIVLMWFQVIRRASHHAIDRPTREMLFTVVSADARYKSKSLIDTFIYRGGDLLGTWLPKGLVSANIPVAWFAVGAATVWGAIGVALGIMQRRQRLEQPPPTPPPAA